MAVDFGHLYLSFVDFTEQIAAQSALFTAVGHHGPVLQEHDTINLRRYLIQVVRDDDYILTQPGEARTTSP